ncbi:two pore domain potassium channel family protein [Vibrio sp. S9_S30]|uniref:potassium channel protein n=1 Tax=Vibrio sp. S9_S30 TaxID=2720226 RepID=UPI00168013FC|nr:potassium channel family protein [Vibrio sp. S9_S30]MBD1555889.1 two pore domain potassium channel family protein [Vibrio sp. S9_S30]
MAVWFTLRRWVYAHLFSLRTKSLLGLAAGYIALSWILLTAAGESDLTANVTDFLYYIVVTSSTVGYGDMSPATPLGRWIVAFFVIPVGLGLFAISVSQLGALVVTVWRAGVLGKRRVNVENHILLLGWNEQRTLHLIRMLQHEETGRRRIVLCVKADIENPLPSEIDFVKVSAFTECTDMVKTNLSAASCIIIDNPEDDVTLSAALYCANESPNAHLLAYFKDEALSRLLKQHCPNAECIPSVATEMLAKAAVDPGSSALHQELLNSTQGMTQYSVEFPASATETQVSELFDSFKKDHQATLIGIDKGQGIELNPSLDCPITAGTTIFYIADERIDNFSWK